MQMITNTAEQANQMLHMVETECRKVGLLINTKKPVMAENTFNIKVIQSKAQF
jgi:hypothetical protein